ncbi:hypothetical protein ABW20_dc0102362 [Dactylellina cionopaga]|nr:hypothetical protein ABW20_dc0102362 [Dactylellina cionopaga]
MSDAQEGGHSKADFALVEEEGYQPAPPSPPLSVENQTYPEYKPIIPKAYGIFHGNISTKLPDQRLRPNIELSGYAGFRTMGLAKTLFGTRFYDTEFYQFIALRVKSDGRTYMVNVQTDSVDQNDLHQHRLFTRKPGEWETVVLKNGGFVRTQNGGIVLDQPAMILEKVRTIGISTTNRVEGPFKLAVHAIWATNTPPPDSVDATIVDGKEEYLDWEHGKHKGYTVW